MRMKSVFSVLALAAFCLLPAPSAMAQRDSGPAIYCPSRPVCGSGATVTCAVPGSGSCGCRRWSGCVGDSRPEPPPPRVPQTLEQRPAPTPPTITIKPTR